MAGYRIKLTDDYEIPAPFDLLYCGQRQTVKEMGKLELKRDPSVRGMLDTRRMKFFIGERLTHEGSIRGDAEFGRIAKTESGKCEVWFDPQYVTRVPRK